MHKILNLIKSWIFRKVIGDYLTVTGNTIYIKDCTIDGIGLTLMAKNVNISGCVFKNCDTGIKGL
jgi:hypothetical protein